MDGRHTAILVITAMPGTDGQCWCPGVLHNGIFLGRLLLKMPTNSIGMGNCWVVREGLVLTRWLWSRGPCGSPCLQMRRELAESLRFAPTCVPALGLAQRAEACTARPSLHRNQSATLSTV